jgi:hypothetical protein
MAKPKVHVYQPVDETGESYKRMAAKGIDLKLPKETWMDVANEDVLAKWRQRFEGKALI